MKYRCVEEHENVATMPPNQNWARAHQVENMVTDILDVRGDRRYRCLGIRGSKRLDDC